MPVPSAHRTIEHSVSFHAILILENGKRVVVWARAHRRACQARQVRRISLFRCCTRHAPECLGSAQSLKRKSGSGKERCRGLEEESEACDARCRTC